MQLKFCFVSIIVKHYLIGRLKNPKERVSWAVRWACTWVRDHGTFSCRSLLNKAWIVTPSQLKCVFWLEENVSCCLCEYLGHTKVTNSLGKQLLWLSTCTWQVVRFKTAANLCAIWRQANDFFSTLFFLSLSWRGITKHLMTAPAEKGSFVSSRPQ